MQEDRYRNGVRCLWSPETGQTERGKITQTMFFHGSGYKKAQGFHIL